MDYSKLLVLDPLGWCISPHRIIVFWMCGAGTSFCVTPWQMYWWCDYSILYGIMITVLVVQLQHSGWHHDYCTGGATTAFCIASWLLYWLCDYSILYSIMINVLVVQLQHSVWYHDYCTRGAATTLLVAQLQHSVWYHDYCTGGATTAFCMVSWLLYW